jgi:hypothetical protein
MKALGVGVILVTALGCGNGTGVSEVSLTDLAGNWEANAIQVANNLVPGQTADAYAEGVRWGITLAESGTFAIDLANPAGTDSYGGVVSVKADSLILESLEITPSRLAMHFALERDGLVLTWLSVEQCGSYGWSAAECPIPVTIRIDLDRVG